MAQSDSHVESSLSHLEGKWAGWRGREPRLAPLLWPRGEGKAGWGSGQRWPMSGMAQRWPGMLGPAGLAGEGAVLAGTGLRPGPMATDERCVSLFQPTVRCVWFPLDATSSPSSVLISAVAPVMTSTAALMC